MAHVVLHDGNGQAVSVSSPGVIQVEAGAPTQTTLAQAYNDLSAETFGPGDVVTVFQGNTEGCYRVSLAVFDEQTAPEPFYTLTFNDAPLVDVYPIIAPDASGRSVFLHNVALPPGAATGTLALVFDQTQFTLTGKMVAKAYLGSV